MGGRTWKYWPASGPVFYFQFIAGRWKFIQNFDFTQFYFHVNGSIGIVQKIDFEIRPSFGMYNPQNVEKSGF